MSLAKYKACVHLSDLDTFDHGLLNIRNLMNDLGGDVEVVLVVNGKAVSHLLKESLHSESGSHIESLVNHGLKIKICHNAMVANDIQDTQVRENIEIVPSGIGALVKLQNKGYAYIRP